MKTLTLEIDDRAIPRLLEFLRELPETRYELFENDDLLGQEEAESITRMGERLASGDDSEFDDWNQVRDEL